MAHNDDHMIASSQAEGFKESITKITSNLYDHLQGKYPDDGYFAKYWARVESGTDTTTSSKEYFHIANGLLYRNGKVCVPDLPEVKKRIL